MSEVTLSPVPFNGGTLSIATRRNIFRLSGDKYVMVYHQTNPDYIIAQVVEITGIKTASPVVTVLRTQVINDAMPTMWSDLVLRAEKLNDTDFLLITENNGDSSSRGYACRVDPATNVVTVISNAPVLFTRAHVTDVRTNHGQWHCAENVVIEVSTTVSSGAGGGQFQIGRFVFNPTTGELSRTVLRNETTPMNNNVYSLSSISRNRTGGTITLTCITYGGSGSVTLARPIVGGEGVTWTYVIDPAAGALVTSIPAVSSAGMHVKTPTALLGFLTNHQYRVQTGTSDATLSPVVSFSSVTSTNAVVYADWLTDNYILLDVLTGATSQTPTSMTGRSFRIVRYVNDSTIQPTDPTNQSSVLTRFNTTGNFLQFNGSANREMYDATTVLLFGISNNTCAVYALTA